MIQLSQFYPTPVELINNERKVLAYLEGDPYIATAQPDFLHDITQYLRQTFKGQKGFDFASHLEIFHSEIPRVKGREIPRTNRLPNVRLILSVQIQQPSSGSFGNITYALVVYRIRSPQPDPAISATQPLILRKFHFDIAAATPGQRLKKPVSHLQYCGTMLPFMKKKGYSEMQLRNMYPKISEPRIFIWPMSLASLIDMAFREFPDSASIKFREANEWRRLLHESEKLLMNRFFKKCVEVVGNPGKSYLTLADTFYL